MAVESQTQVVNDQHFNLSFTNEYDTPATALDILTPTSGKRLAIKGIYVGTEATTGKARLYFGTSNDTVVEIYADAPQYLPLLLKGQRNEPLAMTTSFGANKDYFVLVNYREE